MPHYTLQIAEDHQLFSDGLKSMLLDFKEIEVTGTASTGKETYRNLRLNPPDVLLLDLNLAETNGVEIIDFIKNNKLDTKIIIVSMYYEKNYINLARKRGAHGFVPKNVGKNQLIYVIKKVLEDGSYFEDFVAQSNQLNGIFTSRELEILELYKLGYNSQAIAKLLEISYETVRTHRKHMHQKAKTNNMMQLLHIIGLGDIS